MTKLVKKQKLKFRKELPNGYIEATVRHDDQCGNGHNSFGITGEIYERIRNTGRYHLDVCGCIHEEIKKHFPELTPLLKWHLSSTDGPMHYIANTVYHATAISKHQDKFHTYLTDPELGIRKQHLGIHTGDEVKAIRARYGNDCVTTEEWFNGMAKGEDLAAARRSAVWPDATIENLKDKEQLTARLPALMSEFQSDVESLGLAF